MPPPQVEAGSNPSAPTQGDTGDREVSEPTHSPSALSQAPIATQSCSQLILPSFWSSGSAIQPLVRITFAVVSAHVPFAIPDTYSCPSFGPGQHPRGWYSICHKQGIQNLQHLMATSESPSVTERTYNFWGETKTPVL